MPTSTNKKNKKSTDEQNLLIQASIALIESGTLLEEEYWRSVLSAEIAELIQSKQNQVLMDAAIFLLKEQIDAYSEFQNLIESHASNALLHEEDQAFDISLIAAPILVWGRFTIPSPTINPEHCKVLSNLFLEHITSPNAQVQVIPALFSLEQLPEAYSDIFELLNIGLITLNQGTTMPEPTLESPITCIADTRYLLAIVKTPRPSPLFSWQSMQMPFDPIKAKSDIENKWNTALAREIHEIMPGYALECLRPDGFFAAQRDSDQKIRPISIQAAIFYLSQSLDIDAKELRVVIADFSLKEDPSKVGEYRISFLMEGAPEVIYGVSWNLYSEQDYFDAMANGETRYPQGQIMETLHACGIEQIKHINNLFEPEYCDDCDAPLFANDDGELVHTEMPQEIDPPHNEHFH
jgi:hypothetical protein